MKHLKRLFNYILGYVVISVEGYFIEKFINICISKGMYLWNIDRKKSVSFSAKISISDFRKIKKIAKATKCRVEIEDKKGLPFLFYKYKKRKAFLISLIFVFVLIFYSSTFVWNIEIAGDTKIPKPELLDLLGENGLKMGVKKSSVSKEEIINNIRLIRDDISWIGINIRGTNVIVEIVDVKEKPEIIDPNEFCSIISEKQGVITKIIAQNGTAYVSVGDVIEEGTLLVGGWLDGKYTGTRYVHAEATIEAKVWYSEKEKILLNTTEERRTGKEEKKYSLNLNNFKINFYKTVTKFKSYDTICDENKLKVFSENYLPIIFTKQVNYELENVEVHYTTEEAKVLGIQRLEERLLTQIKDSKNIINKQINYYYGEDYVEVELIYEVLEQIGTKEKINVQEVLEDDQKLE